MFVKFFLVFIFFTGSLFSYDIKDLTVNDKSYNIIKIEKDNNQLYEIYNKTEYDVIKSKVLLNEYIPVELIYKAIKSKNARLINSAKQNILYSILVSKDKNYLEKQLLSKNGSIVKASKLALKNLSNNTKSTPTKKVGALTKSYVLNIKDTKKLEDVYFANPPDIVKQWVLDNPFLSVKIYKDILSNKNRRLTNKLKTTTFYKVYNSKNLSFIEKYNSSTNKSIKEAYEFSLFNILSSTKSKDIITKYMKSIYNGYLLVNPSLSDKTRINLLKEVDKKYVLEFIKKNKNDLNKSKTILEWLYNHKDKEIYDYEGVYLPMQSKKYPDFYMKVFDVNNKKKYKITNWQKGLIGANVNGVAQKYILNSENYIKRLLYSKLLDQIVDNYMLKHDIDDRIKLYAIVINNDRNNLHLYYDKYIKNQVFSASISNKQWLDENTHKVITYSFTQGLYLFFILSFIGNIVLFIIILLLIVLYAQMKKKKNHKIEFENIKNNISKYKDDISDYFLNIEEYKTIPGFNELLLKIEKLQALFLDDFALVSKLESYSKDNSKKLNTIKSKQEKNVVELQKLKDSWDKLIIEIKPILENFDKLLKDVTSEVSKLENQKSKVQELDYFKEFNSLYKRISERLKVLFNLKHKLNSSIKTIDEFKKVLDESSSIYVEESNLLKELYVNVEETFNPYNLNNNLKSKLKKYFESLKSSMQTLFNNNARELDKFSEIKEMIKNLQDLEINLNSKISLLDKKFDNLNSFHENIKNCEIYYEEYNKKFLIEKESFDKIKIELERYKEISDDLAKRLSKTKKFKKELDKYKNLLSLEDYDLLLDQIDELEKFINHSLSAVYDKETRKTFGILEKKYKLFDNNFENFEKIYNSKFKMKKEFDSLNTFHDKKNWILDNGYISWLFKDENISEEFEFLDDYQLFSQLINTEFNVKVKWFPYKHNNKDTFYEKLEDNMPIKELSNLLGEYTKSKSISKYNTSKYKPESLTAIVRKISGIKNKLKNKG